MTTIYLEIEVRQSRASVPVSKQMLWYNVKTRKMQKFEGSELRFKYDSANKEMVPYIDKPLSETEKRINESFYQPVSNKKKLIAWILANQLFLEFELNNEETKSGIIAIDVLDKNVESVVSSLDKEGFRYSIISEPKSDRK